MTSVSTTGHLPRLVRCPVCGAGLSGTVWRCEQCDTPHHEDCAKYFGGCGIFGCRDGRAPARLEVESWPEAARLLEQMMQLQRARLRMALASVVVALTIPAVMCLPIAFYAQYLFIPAYVGLIALLARIATLDGEMGVLRSRLEKASGAERLEAAEKSWKRVKQLLPSTRLVSVPVVFISKLDGIGTVAVIAAAVVAIVAGMVLSSAVLFVGGFFFASLGALMMLGLGSAANGHRTVVEVAARFEAAFAPRLAAEAKPALLSAEKPVKEEAGPLP